MHAALELLVVDFPNLGLVSALHRNEATDAICAAAMSDLLLGFSDLGYFVAASRCARQLSATNRMPLHRLGRLRLWDEFISPQAGCDPPKRDNEFADLGRDVKAIFECVDEESSRPPSPLELVHDARSRVGAGSVALYNLLQDLHSCEDEPCEIEEPQLVRAAATVAACRLCLALFSASRTIVNAGEENVPLPLHQLASKMGELCQFVYVDRMTAMADALRSLPPEPIQAANTLHSDRYRLESDYWASRLAHSDGVWFLLPVEERGLGSWAFLSKCGSIIQSVEGTPDGLRDGETWHRFREPDEDGTLPSSVTEAWAGGNFTLI